jgi:ribosomal protein S27E
MSSQTTSFITTECPTCGPTDIAIGHVVLVVDEAADRSFASIRCPACGARFCRRVDDGMCLLMTAVGVVVRERTRPAEVDERPVGGPPLTSAEVEAFAAVLSSGADLVQLAGG